LLVTIPIQRNNERAAVQWRSAGAAQGALTAIANMEATRAQVVSANQFDHDRLVQSFRQQQFALRDSMVGIEPGLVGRLDQMSGIDRAMQIYLASADRQMALAMMDPERAGRVASDEVIPNYTRLWRSIELIRDDLSAAGPTAQSKVDRDLGLALPAFGALFGIAGGAMLGARKRASLAKAAAEQDARFRAIVDGATDVLSVIGADGHFREVSPSARDLFGIEPSLLVGTDAATLLTDADRVAFVEVLESVQRERTERDITVRVRHNDGRARVVELHGSHSDALDGTAWVWHDVTEQTELADQLRRSAFEDDLTGLANRALLRDRASMALADPSSVAMLLVDLDRFQPLNDALGHSVGDEILRTVAGRMRACVRPSDTVARIAGDEFAALVSGADERALDAVVERMLDACRQPMTIEGREVRVTVSIGVARATKDGDVEDLIRRADTALATAKSSGRDRAQMHAEVMDQRARQRLVLATELHSVVERDQLRAVYQPIVSLADGHVTGFEALVRWHHPEHGVVSPVEFIPLAEDNGTIIAIGRWMLNTAVDRAVALPASTRMNVNLSARQLSDPSLVDDVRVALQRSGLDPARLVLEITESQLLEDADATMAVLTSLRELGCLLAIDDFGTGYSSLGYLRKLPVDIVKLDKSFLDARVATSDGERAFLESVLQIGRTLGLETVAEGIEDQATADALAAIGCDKGQGYLFSKPVDAERAAAIASTVYKILATASAS
jgi:diguanylate cyclase (GGDEF)-like protein/PAS domain S-box-containing protein